MFSSARRAVAVAAVPALAVATLAASGSFASAAQQATGGRVNVYEVYPSLAPSTSGSDVLTGAITDFGHDQRGVAGDGKINLIALSKGSFEVDTAALKQKPTQINWNTCSFTGGYTGLVSVVKGSGTGSYAGIRGSVSVNVTTLGILPTLPDGACAVLAQPVAGVSWLQGSGTVAFGTA